MVRGVIEGCVEAGLDETKFECAKLRREEADCRSGLGRWDQDAVYCVNDAIASELI